MHFLASQQQPCWLLPRSKQLGMRRQSGESITFQLIGSMFQTTDVVDKLVRGCKNEKNEIKRAKINFVLFKKARKRSINLLKFEASLCVSGSLTSMKMATLVSRLYSSTINFKCLKKLNLIFSLCKCLQFGSVCCNNSSNFFVFLAT